MILEPMEFLIIWIVKKPSQNKKYSLQYIWKQKTSHLRGFLFYKFIG